MDNLGLALILLFYSSQTHAQEIFLSYGLGAFNSSASLPSPTINGGYRYELYNGFYWHLTGGYWKDNSTDPTRKSSAYFSTGPGLLVDLNPVEIRNSVGLAAITNPDGYLGGSFPEFNEEIYVGLRDRHGNGIGVKYDHISSAGIYQPNIGRDFIMLEVSSKW